MSKDKKYNGYVEKKRIKLLPEDLSEASTEASLFSGGFPLGFSGLSWMIKSSKSLVGTGVVGATKIEG